MNQAVNQNDYSTYLLGTAAALIFIGIVYAVKNKIDINKTLGERIIPLFSAIQILMILSELYILAKVYQRVFESTLIEGITSFIVFVSFEFLLSIAIVYLSTILVVNNFKLKDLFTITIVMIFNFGMSTITLYRWAVLINLDLITAIKLLFIQLSGSEMMKHSLEATLIMASPISSVIGFMLYFLVLNIEARKKNSSNLMVKFGETKIYKSQLKQIETAITLAKMAKTEEKNNKFRLQGEQLWYLKDSTEHQINLDHVNDLGIEVQKKLVNQVRNNAAMNTLKLSVLLDIKNKVKELDD